MQQSLLEPNLIDAFLATDYRVNGPQPFTLKINRKSQSLEKLYEEHGHNCAAYLTSCNPYSENVGDIANASLHRELARELAARGFFFLPGVGQDSLGKWPGEPSYLILGMDLDAAKTLGQKYRQNALVWCGPDAVPQLILLR